MGCVNSKVDKEETVRRSRERKRLMKQLIGCRAAFAAAHLAYLRSLKNTGATLRQFTDVESLLLLTNNSSSIIIPGGGGGGGGEGEEEEASLGLRLPPPPPPPPPLPPSPPPPQFIPHLKKPEGDLEQEKEGKDGPDKKEEKAPCFDIIDDDDDDDDDYDDDESCSPPPPPPPPPPIQGSACWEFWDPFGPPSSSISSSSKEEDEEDWAEANIEFRREAEAEAEAEEQQQQGAPFLADNLALDLVREDNVGVGYEISAVDDNSSGASILTKETDMLVVWRTRKSLAAIVKEIDDYFLKAAAAGNEVLSLLDSHNTHRLHWMEQAKGKSSKSPKVFSALSWNWSLKSPQSGKHAHGQEGRSPQCSEDASGQEARDASSYTNHCATLEKLHAKEQTLYKQVKEEELLKVLNRKKTLLMQKLEARENDCTKIEEMGGDVENLHSQLLSLQESISETCLSISKLRDEELYPQLAKLTSGLMQMWRTMRECHQVQNHIAQQANLLDRHHSLDPTTESHRFATAQLESEVTNWCNAFCNLLKSQRDYVQILNQWVGLTDCLPVTSEVIGSGYGLHHLSEEWQLSLDRLPDKVASEAIKSFLSVVHSILVQQKEEQYLLKKTQSLERRLEKELTCFSDLDKHQENPASATKLEALKKRVEEEKAKYVSSVRNSRAMMTLNNLQTGLPNVFQALMGFAGACAQAFEGISLPAEEATTSAHLGRISPLSDPQT